jgi:predicted nucleic acid-binding protein
MIVLDTNVISEAMLPVPNVNVRHWLSSQSSPRLFTTTVSLAEILYGIEILPPGKRRDGLLRTAETMFANLFARRLLAFDALAARSFPVIAASRRRHGRPISILDAQIAAIAHVNDATFATRNTADFQGCGIRLANPWLD